MRLSTLASKSGLLASAIAAILCAAGDAGAGNVDDTVFLTGGGRVRGLVVEQSPTSGVRLKLPDGSIRVIAAKDVDHITLGSQPPAPTSTAPSPPPGAARIRLRATCAKSASVLGPADELVVEEIAGSAVHVLSPAGADPQFVDYELPSGPHQVRVHAKRCASHEESLQLQPGQTFELTVHLDATPVPAVPVAFARPSFADSSETIALHDSSGNAVCANLPCTANVPVTEQSYYLEWTKASGRTLTASVPDPGEGSAPGTFDARLDRKTSVGALAPVTIGVGGLVGAVGLLMIANNGGADTDGVNHSGNRTAGTGIAIGGAIVVVGGLVMILTGVGGHEKLAVTLGAPAKAPATARFGFTADGVGATF